MLVIGTVPIVAEADHGDANWHFHSVTSSPCGVDVKGGEFNEGFGSQQYPQAGTKAGFDCGLIGARLKYTNTYDHQIYITSWTYIADPFYGAYALVQRSSDFRAHTSYHYAEDSTYYWYALSHSHYVEDYH